MAYVLPAFNLAVNIWRGGPGSPSGPPDVVTVGNISPGKVTSGTGLLTALIVDVSGAMWLRLPAGTDVRTEAESGYGDVLEVPASSGRLYESIWVDEIGGGFPNEHRFAVLIKYGAWPLPYPSCGGFTPYTLPSFGGVQNYLGNFVAGKVKDTFSASAGINASDVNVGFFLVLVNSGGAPTFKVDGLASIPLASTVGPVQGGLTPTLYVLMGVPGVGPHTFEVDASGGGKQQTMGASVLITNPPVHSQWATVGFSPGAQPMQVAELHANIGVIPRALVACICEVAGPAIGLPFVVPFALTGGTLQATVGGLNVNMALGTLGAFSVFQQVAQQVDGSSTNSWVAGMAQLI